MWSTWLSHDLALQVVLTFIVLDWDGPLMGDDLLGVAKFTLQEVWQCGEP